MRDMDAVIVWINYNSSRILDVVLDSLRSVAELDYDRWSLLIVDNGSVDGSIEEIERFVESLRGLRERTKILKLGANLGFTGASNVAWRYVVSRYGEAKYLVMLNNDAIVYPHSLRQLVEYLDSIPRVCGVQGIIELRNSGRVDSYGCYVDELLTVYPFMWLKNVDEIPRKCFAVTYVAGTYAVYKIDALKKMALRSNYLFPTEAFAYLDDDLLGILAYANGFYMIAVPIHAAKHFSSLSFRITGLRNYFGLRNLITKSIVINTRYRPLSILHALRATLKRALSARKQQRGMLLRAVVDGIALSKTLRKKYGLRIEGDVIRGIPLIPLNLVQALQALASYRPTSASVLHLLENYVIQRYGFRC